MLDQKHSNILKINRKCTTSERKEQIALMTWARMQLIPLVGHATGGLKSARSGAIDKKMGVSRGYPDLSLLKAHGGYFGMFIEMKQNRTYQPSERKTDTWLAQIECISKLNADGYYATFAYGWEMGAAYIKRYLSLPPTLREGRVLIEPSSFGCII